MTSPLFYGQDVFEFSLVAEDLLVEPRYGASRGNNGYLQLVAVDGEEMSSSKVMPKSKLCYNGVGIGVEAITRDADDSKGSRENVDRSLELIVCH